MLRPYHDPCPVGCVLTHRKALLFPQAKTQKPKVFPPGAPSRFFSKKRPLALDFSFEKFLHLGKKPFMLRAAGAMRFRLVLKFLHQLALPAGEVLRRLNRNLDIHIAALRAAEYRKPLRAQPELLAALGAGGNFHLRGRAIDGRHLDLAAQCGLRHAQRHPAENIGAITLEYRMRTDPDMHI